ncbi:MAG: hypothetical protein DRJ66_06560 [Thermoprotei archaeon]|nr:MAG: hypothetical protein DRJ66_06560 [Thermoprotei archaeon]RLF20664.1 MAG: hypothetical protein DRZ82_01425 [Thermoprotei archaeon]
MISWEEFKTKICNALKSRIPEVEIFPYKHYVHIKRGGKSIRLMYSYGQLRILDESTRKVKVLKPDITLDEVIEEVINIIT